MSCLQENGEYGERVFDHITLPAFEAHLGPEDEFALFMGITTVHRDHDNAINLLYPAYHRSDLSTFRDSRTWSREGIIVNVIALDSSRRDCESYHIRVERKKR